MKRSAGGLTAIEVLMVIVVVGILAGLLTTSILAIGRTEKRRRTETALGLVGLALAVAGGERGGGYAGVEHPLAGSAPGGSGGMRPRFVRSGDGSTVARTGEALVVRDPAWLSGSQDRVLRPDDIYAGGDDLSPQLPLLYGIERRRCRVLGGAWPAVTTYRDLPSPEDIRWDRDRDGRLDPPYSAAGYPDAMFLVSGDAAGAVVAALRATDAAEALRARTPEQRSAAAIGTMLGGDTVAELRKLRCLRQSSDPAVTAELLLEERVARRIEQPPPADPARWRPGAVRLADGTWAPYQIRGWSLVDAWGSDVLVSLDADGRLRVESAGADGAFRWHPGDDGVYQTAARDSVPAGDDRDAAADNLTNGGKQR